MGLLASPIIVVVLVVGWGSKWLRKDGRMDEGRKASGGSFVRSAGKRPRTKDDDEDDWEAEDLTVKNPRLTNKLIICFIL